MRLLILFSMAAVLLSAHPHCFIDVYPSVGKEKVTIRWLFDDMSSQMMLMDFDRDHDGQLNASESRNLYAEAFASLKSYEYYTYFYRGSVKLPTGTAEGFTAAVEQNRISYTFSLPLPDGATDVRFYDDELFTAFVLEPAFVREANPGRAYTIKPFESANAPGYLLELK